MPRQHYRHEVFGQGLLFFVDRNDGAAGLALEQRRAVALQQVGEFLGLLVRTHFCLLLDLCETGFNRLKVLDLQLCVHDFLVADRVYAAVHMDDVAIIKAAEYVQDGIGLAYVGQELVTETLALAGTLHQAGDVDYVDRGRDGALRLAEVRQGLQPLVRHVGGAEVRLNGTEREIGALGLSGAYTVEEGGFTDVRQTDYTAFQ